MYFFSVLCILVYYLLYIVIDSFVIVYIFMPWVGPLTLGDDADVTLQYVGKLIPDTVRDSAVESDAFWTSDTVARIQASGLTCTSPR